MRRRPARALAAVLGAAALGAVAVGAAPVAAAPFAPKAPEPASPGARDGSFATFGRTLPGRGRLLVTFADRPTAAEAGVRLGGVGDVVPVLPEAGIWGVEPDDPPGARRQVLPLPGVASAEWSLARSAGARPRPLAPLALPPPPLFEDPLFRPGVQWGLFRNWRPELTGLAPRPRIAILDTGIDAGHEEWRGDPAALAEPRSSVRNSSEAADWSTSGHGTHVAGIAAAPANGIGVVGVAPASSEGAQLIPVQITDPVGNSDDDTIIRGIRWAVRHGAKVINISSGGEGYTRAFRDTVFWATGRGALIVAAVGNEGDSINSLNYPAAFPKVLGVGAQCDENVSADCPEPYGAALFSNYNRSVDLIAPGVDVASSVPVAIHEREVAPGYALKTGTSMAAPYVTGVAALVQASNGNRLSPYQLLRQLLNTATDTGPRGLDRRSGHGIINPGAAVTLRAPADDHDEVNDDIKFLGKGQRAKERVRRQVIEATIDAFDDREDVYPVVLRAGERVTITLRHSRARLRLYFWRPGTRTVATAGGNGDTNVLRYDGRKGRKAVTARAPSTGRYYVNVYAQSGRTAYRLSITRSS